MPTREIQDRASPQDVLDLLKIGNQRFATGQTLDRDPRRQVQLNAADQNPLAVVLACMDSRVATEIVFDVGLGDIFSIRIAGNTASPQALGSMEFGCAMAGAKLVLVLGHRRCGAVTRAVDVLAGAGDLEVGDHENLAAIIDPIAEAVRAETETSVERHGRNREFVDRVTVLNVRRSMREIYRKSRTLRELIDEGSILLVGAVYDVDTGRVEFLKSEASSPGP